jgi:hypothetical protein
LILKDHTARLANVNRPRNCLGKDKQAPSGDHLFIILEDSFPEGKFHHGNRRMDMRLALIPLLGMFIAAPAMAQVYYQAPIYAPQAYGYSAEYNGAWDAAREEWHQARRAEDIARWRAANGDYYGANRAQYWANLHRERARHDANVARGGW